MERQQFNWPPAKPINWFAVVGLALGTTLLSCLVVGLIYLAQPENYNSVSTLVTLAGSLLIVFLFLGLPLLLGSRFGWRTVIMSYMLQALLLFAAAWITVSFSNQSTDGTSCDQICPGTIQNGIDRTLQSGIFYR